MKHFARVMAIMVAGTAAYWGTNYVLGRMVSWSWQGKMAASWIVGAAVATLAYRLLYGHWPRPGD